MHSRGPAGAATQSRPLSIPEWLAAVGLGSPPIAVIGLWLVRAWAVFLLVIGWVLLLVTFPVVAPFHMLILLFTALRYSAQREHKSGVTPTAAAERSG